MKIIKAENEHLDIVRDITQKTIKQIYPLYYPEGAVKFFFDYHNDENIKEDISKNCVYLLSCDDEFIGTVTVNGNEINRLFVLPEYQHKGFGSALLDFAENKIAESYDEIALFASLQASNLYRKRGYFETYFGSVMADNGDMLSYHTMIKYCKPKLSKISYDNRKFIPKSNSENGEVDGSTVFCYHQKNNLIWAEYSGGEILKGFLLGTTDENGCLKFNYQHINNSGITRIGECSSTPKITDSGKLEMHENWQWLNGDGSKGNSILVEL